MGRVEEPSKSWKFNESNALAEDHSPNVQLSGGSFFYDALLGGYRVF